MPAHASPASTPADSDQLTRFLLPDAGVRGVRVHLSEAWAHIRTRDAYPAAVERLLGQATAAAALFTGHAKVEGRLSVQLRSASTLRTLFAECTAAGTLRAIAQLSEDDTVPISDDLRELGDDAILAITIENPRAGATEPMRYQGIVELSASDLPSAFEGYFQQSEQLPTRLLLAADDNRAAGLMLQKLPGDSGDDDGWNRAGALFDTLSSAELLDLPCDVLLARLFAEEAPQLLGSRPLRFACSCSRERVAAMLESLGIDEARAAVIDGRAQVRCEFCGQDYRFSSSDIDAMFTAVERQMDAPDSLQ